ncbi:MAG: DHH family phosphoesterase [Patescibacteria group bacterium]
MERTEAQQSIDLIKKSANIVIVLPKNPSTDAVASGLGLFLALEKVNKKVRVVCNEFSLPPSHQFLPKSGEIHSDLSALRKFIITLDLSRTKVRELSYDISNNSKLNIYVTPKDGFFEPRDVSTSASAYEYDLIITLDSPNLESLGKIYDDNTEFFYHTPLINIDHNPSNEYFGEINSVDLVATSTSEIIFELIRQLNGGAMDEYIATSLLTGIISKTKSFQSTTVTPRSLAISSLLIENGARRDDIIKHLYRTKTISTLKLWGRALARLKTDLDGRLVWSLLNNQDFEKSGAGERELEGVVDELIVNTPDAEIIVLIYESNSGSIRVIVNTIKSIDGLRLFKEYKPAGTRNFTKFKFDRRQLLEVEAEVLATIREFIKNQ